MKTFPEKPHCQRLNSTYDDKKRSTQLACGPCFESIFSERFLILTKFPILSYCNRLTPQVYITSRMTTRIYWDAHELWAGTISPSPWNSSVETSSDVSLVSRSTRAATPDGRVQQQIHCIILSHVTANAKKYQATTLYTNVSDYIKCNFSVL